jgi:signal transduction histidine kinase
VDNAEKFSMDGGNVNISLQLDGRQIIFIVSDNGVGITE